VAYVDGDDFFSLREPALADDERLGFNRADRKPKVGKDGDDAGEKSLQSQVSAVSCSQGWKHIPR
jgi:hypothetical protein